MPMHTKYQYSVEFENASASVVDQQQVGLKTGLNEFDDQFFTNTNLNIELSI
jgi:hypothetical protein